MVVLHVACTAPAAPPDLSLVASRYIQLTRALAQHDPSLIDHWLIQPPGDVGPRRPVLTLRGEADALADAVQDLVPATEGLSRWRARSLLGQAHALQLAAQRLMGESAPFDAEARRGLGRAPSRADLFQVDRAREALERELPGPGPLVERVAAFRARFVVRAADRDHVMRLALDECRAATRHEFGLPGDDGIELAFVEGLPWDAHARYLGGHRTRIEVNASRPLDLPRALRLACHEGYAGHHAQYIWMVDTLVGERGWEEFSLVPGFGPHLLVSEGAAEAGADLAMPLGHRIAVYRDRLAPAAGFPAGGDLDRLARLEDHLAVFEPLIGDIAREYLDNRINATTAKERLSREALVADTEGMVLFIERRRSRLLAYSEGRRVVRAQLGGAGLAGLRALFTDRALQID
ncbi:MAG: hypothetical protein IT177_25685 [Acidobacteria bacterium]|nr:hypothetical protein [Acidobacteriota bacterium]